MIVQIYTGQIKTTQVKKLFLRPTLSALDDAAGVAVLFVLLFAGLTLSGAA